MRAVQRVSHGVDAGPPGYFDYLRDMLMGGYPELHARVPIDRQMFNWISSVGDFAVPDTRLLTEVRKILKITPWPEIFSHIFDAVLDSPFFVAPPLVACIWAETMMASIGKKSCIKADEGTSSFTHGTG